MNTSQLEFQDVVSLTPEQRVAEIIRRARARYGKNLRPFYEELLKQQPKPPEDRYADLVVIAQQKRNRD